MSVMKLSTMASNGIKGIVRVAIRIVVELIHRVTINLFDTLFGFLNWPAKKLRVKIFILINPEDNAPASPAEAEKSIDFAMRSFEKKFNVKLLPHRAEEPFAELLQKIPPSEALRVKCNAGAISEEFKIAGTFFSSNLCGPLYPVTAFVVIDISGKDGCCIGPVTDYLTLDPNGIRISTTLAHEIGHSCGLWHIRQRSNLMWPHRDRGNDIQWWQKNLFRGSRHVTYW
jgi:hypothetical protein